MSARRTGGLLAGLAAALAVAAPAAAQAPSSPASSSSGSLRVSAGVDRFDLVADGAGGRAVLRDGAIAVRGSTATAHATRVVGTTPRPGGLVEVQLATDVPRETVELTLQPGSSDGTMRVTALAVGTGVGAVQAVSASFALAPDERMVGTGERSTAVDLRGQEVLNYVSDGPFAPGDRPYAAAVTPSWGAAGRDDDTYYPVPWVLSSEGHGVLIRNDETSRFDLGRTDPGRWSAEADARDLALTVYDGPTPADALARFTDDTGRQPATDAPWAYGPWVQTGQPNTVPLDDEARIITTLRVADAPFSALETQLRNLPCGLQRGNEGYEAQRIAQTHAAGLAILTYFNPEICQDYEPAYSRAAAAGALQTGADGAPFTFNAFVGGVGAAGFTVKPVAQFDFTTPAGVAAYEALLREALDRGEDGWMEDFGEYASPDAHAADGTTGSALHNRYPTDYHCAVAGIQARAGRPIVRFQRSGWTGAAKCASVVWGGDPTTTYGYDGLRSVVTQALSIGLSGVSRWGTDIGGYDTLGDDERLSPELLRRWVQLGSVLPVMRTKRSGLAIPGYERPQVFDPDVLPTWRRATKLHTQLTPYLEAADADYRDTGVPILRAGLLTDPDEPAVADAEDQFGVGDDLLAAPVLEPGATTRTVHVPAGDWVDLWRSTTFRQDDGALLPATPRLVAGGADATLDAPQDGGVPLLVRAGSVLPLLPADVDSTAPYRADGVVSAADRADELTLLAFPRGDRTARLGAGGDRVRSVEGDGRWTLSFDASTRRTYTLRASLGTLERPFRPCSVQLGGREVDGWQYDAATSALTATFAADRGQLVVTACPSPPAPVVPATPVAPAPSPPATCTEASPLAAARTVARGRSLRLQLPAGTPGMLSATVRRVARGARIATTPVRGVRAARTATGLSVTGLAAAGAGVYVARVVDRTATATATRSVAFAVRGGRVATRGAIDVRSTCGPLRLAALDAPVLGGSRGRALVVRARPAAAGRVTVRIRRGGRTLRTVTRTVAAGRTARIAVAAAGLPRGELRVEVAAGGGTASLAARRL